MRYLCRPGNEIVYEAAGRHWENPSDNSHGQLLYLAYGNNGFKHIIETIVNPTVPFTRDVAWEKGGDVIAEYKDALWWHAHQISDYQTLDKKILGVDERPQLIVLTGFLGSGKTSFLQHFIEYQVQLNRLFLFSAKSAELKIAASYGLSDEYLDKRPISSMHSIATSLEDGKPAAIFDVADDPRIQYPEAALKEGIASILSVPIIIGAKLIGCMRVYTAQPWEFTLNDVNFVQAVAQVVGMALEKCRINKGLKDSIDILKTMRDPKSLKSKKRTPYEGVPKSFTSEELTQVRTCGAP